MTVIVTLYGYMLICFVTFNSVRDVARETLSSKVSLFLNVKHARRGVRKMLLEKDLRAEIVVHGNL